MTDRQDTQDQHEARLSRGLTFLRTRLGLLLFAQLFLMGQTRGCDDRRPATITCTDVIMQIEPGTCVPLPNPCNDSGRWAAPPAYDGFALRPSDEIRTYFAATGLPVSVHTMRGRSEVTRSICVTDDSPHFPGLDIDFRYGLGVQWGGGSLIVSVAPILTVEVNALPTSIALGETSQLVATARGGIPPYFYSWIPTTWLNDTDIAAPIASPGATTTYGVSVTDSGGREVIADVTIVVGTGLTVTANPQEIPIGDVAILVATASGGTPPYTFTWTPAETLDDPHRQNPLAMPETTITYQVTAVDAVGATMTGSATVTVRMEVTATAEPQEVLAGGTTRLLAAARGGTEPYTYEWTPADTLDDPHRQDPIAAPAAATTYQVIARDSAGAAAGGAVTVLVVGDDPPPTASFVFGVECCPRLELDATASTGHIVAYSWDLGWTSANPDRITSSPTTSFTIQEFNRGPITLTVTGIDGRTATATQNF